MRIVQVSPYPPERNGIGDYTRDLCAALNVAEPAATIVVLATRDPAVGDCGGVRYCLDFGGDWPAQFKRAIAEERPDVVHLQHGWYMGLDGRVGEALRHARAQGVATVGTLHGVWPTTLWDRWPRHLHHDLASHVDRVIIHQHAGSHPLLIGDGVPAVKIAVIPHGTAIEEPIPAADARRQLGLPVDARVVLNLGLIYRRKGVHTLIRAFDAVARQVPDARLVVVGRVRRDNPIDTLYNLWLDRGVRRGQAAGWLDCRREHVPEDQLSVYIHAADIIAFPYLRPYGSASGVFHRALAAGRAVVCSRCATFGEAVDAWGAQEPEMFATPGDVADWSRALHRALVDDEMRTRVMRRAATLARETSWPSVAARHLELYRSIVPPEAGPDTGRRAVSTPLPEPPS
ncbi:MAG: glycosyltransferase [Nannocystis sp.]|uniref:glycosyltransferase n=1 Tax=Nannocystis sp. TaxID=1962667 RepID=UPI00242197F0|nr:glycosyltransferase [Nannocystis sp.]MBK9757258.1 glycosyltransferase [Nannocystis sp.]